MTLDPELIQSIVFLCLLRPDEPRDDAIEVEGIVRDYSFHRGRIAENADIIIEQLTDLPDQFKAAPAGGGGWSFLNACNDRNDNKWTGLHQRMEELVCFGIAAGKVRWLLRDIAGALHGGMPHVVIDYSQRNAST